MHRSSDEVAPARGERHRLAAVSRRAIARYLHLELDRPELVDREAGVRGPVGVSPARPATSLRRMRERTAEARVHRRSSESHVARDRDVAGERAEGIQPARRREHHAVVVADDLECRGTSDQAHEAARGRRTEDSLHERCLSGSIEPALREQLAEHALGARIQARETRIRTGRAIAHPEQRLHAVVVAEECRRDLGGDLRNAVGVGARPEHLGRFDARVGVGRAPHARE